MAKRVVKNPYKLQQVTPVEPKKKAERVGPPPPAYAVGDELTTVYKPLLYWFTPPIIARGIRESDNSASGWLVSVDTNRGLMDLATTHFRKK